VFTTVLGGVFHAQLSLFVLISHHEKSQYYTVFAVKIGFSVRFRENSSIAQQKLQMNELYQCLIKSEKFPRSYRITKLDGEPRLLSVETEVEDIKSAGLDLEKQKRLG
jgi:hypothetical protein